MKNSINQILFCLSLVGLFFFSNNAKCEIISVGYNCQVTFGKGFLPVDQKKIKSFKKKKRKNNPQKNNLQRSEWIAIMWIGVAIIFISLLVGIWAFSQILNNPSSFTTLIVCLIFGIIGFILFLAGAGGKGFPIEE